MSKPYKAPELVKPRSNPSEAERGRSLSQKDEKKYRIIMISGIILFLGSLLTIALQVLGILPFSILSLIAICTAFLSLFLIDIGGTKGKDHRYHRGIND